MAEVKKTIDEWCTEYETVIMDADGFPKHTTWDTPLTRKEFLQGMMGSTIQFGSKINEAFKNLINDG